MEIKTLDDGSDGTESESDSYETSEEENDGQDGPKRADKHVQ